MLSSPRRVRLVAALLVAALSSGGAAALAGPSYSLESAGVGGRVGSSGFGDDYFPLDGNGGLDVRRYVIDDTYRFGSGRLTGTTTLDIRAIEPLSRFNLDLLLPVRSVTVQGVPATFSKPNKHEVQITPATPLAQGERFTVVVRFAGHPGGVSYLGESNWLADEVEVVTMNQPHMAPWWFAANDHPADKALMDISITVPSHKGVIANGRRVGRTVDGRWATTRWKPAEPMATYLAFFAAGDWKVASGERGGLPWRAVVSRHLTDAQQRASMQLMRRTPDIIAALEQDLGDYPFSTSGGLTTALPVYFALENQTMPTYPVLGSSGHTIVVHEQAHQWFGDHVAVRRWSDIWLNEGAATFMEVRYDEQHGGPSAQKWLDDEYDAREGGERFWDLPLGDPGPGHLFDTAVYQRGAMTFQALRNRIGESDFWALLRRWVDEQGGGNGSTAKFIALAEDVSGEDLDTFFDAWLQAGKPADVTANGLG